MLSTLGFSAALSCVIAASPTTTDARAVTAQSVGPSNVLVIVADDVGWDMLRSYGVHLVRPPTPTLDALAARGVLFERAYANPFCSPTRAEILTGRYGFRTGIGQVSGLGGSTFALPDAEITLAEAVRDASAGAIDTSAIGKWHLAPGANAHLAPNAQGFAWFAGTLGNLLPPQSFFNHSKVVNGVVTNSTQYATTEQVDDALARAHAMREPWFLYLAFNAAHEPLYAPPPDLHGYQLSGPPGASPVAHYQAAVQAMDTEIGRLFASMDPAVLARTNVIFIGDNGTPGNVSVPPLSSLQAKGSLLEGGVHVPLIVAGPAVSEPGRSCDALVSAVDVFATSAELLGVSLAPQQLGARVDSISFAPYLARADQAALRRTVFAESFAPNGFGPHTSWQRMLRDARWKVIVRSDTADEFYDLGDEWLEGANLLLGPLTVEQGIAYARLKAELTQLVSE